MKLKIFESLIVNSRLICINPKPRTKMKKKLKFGLILKFDKTKLHKIKSFMAIRGAIERNQKREDQIEFDQIPKLKP
jgi:hypothetical protein